MKKKLTEEVRLLIRSAVYLWINPFFFLSYWEPSHIHIGCAKDSGYIRFSFKYALAYLLRGARHALHDILLLRTSAIRRRLYLGRRLDSHQNEFALLATYRGGSLIYFQDKLTPFLSQFYDVHFFIRLLSLSRFVQNLKSCLCAAPRQPIPDCHCHLFSGSVLRSDCR